MLDIYIDDVGITAKVKVADLASKVGWDWEAAASVDQAYADLRILQSHKKAVHGESVSGEIWGQQIQGREGLVGPPWQKRVPLCFLTLMTVSQPVSGKMLASVLGSLSHVFLSRRLAVLSAEACLSGRAQMAPDEESAARRTGGR
jgi:hypothetical protein